MAKAGKIGKREKFADCVAAGMPVNRAATVAGVGQRTAYRWMTEDTELQQRIAGIRRENVARALHRLTAVSARAANRLARLVRSKNERIALLASRAVLELRAKMFESEELERRLTELEQRAAAQQQPAGPKSNLTSDDLAEAIRLSKGIPPNGNRLNGENGNGKHHE